MYVCMYIYIYIYIYIYVKAGLQALVRAAPGHPADLPARQDPPPQDIIIIIIIIISSSSSSSSSSICVKHSVPTTSSDSKRGSQGSNDSVQLLPLKTTIRTSLMRVAEIPCTGLDRFLHIKLLATDSVRLRYHKIP